MAARTAWRICSEMGWWSAFGKPKRGKGKKPGPPVHNDLLAERRVPAHPLHHQLGQVDLGEMHERQSHAGEFKGQPRFFERLGKAGDFIRIQTHADSRRQAARCTPSEAMLAQNL